MTRKKDKKPHPVKDPPVVPLSEEDSGNGPRPVDPPPGEGEP